MSIITTIEDTVGELATFEDVTFGHGTRTEENLREDISYPAAWLMPFVEAPDYQKSGLQQSVFNLLMDFHERVEFDASPEEQKTSINNMRNLAREFIHRLGCKGVVESISNVRIEPLYFVLDDVLIGVAVSFTVVYEYEAITGLG